MIIRCTLAQIQVYDRIVQCSGHPDTKAYISVVFLIHFQFYMYLHAAVISLAGKVTMVLVESSGSLPPGL